MRGSSSSSHALWCTFASLCACDHTLLGGDWIFSLHLGHQWLDESMSESLILVGRSTKLHVACSRAHTFTQTLTVWDPDVSSSFFLSSASAGRHVAFMAQAQAAYWWADLVPIHFTQTFLLSGPPHPLFFTHTAHTHTHEHTHHVSDEASRGWKLCATGQREIIMSFKARCNIILTLRFSCLLLQLQILLFLSHIFKVTADGLNWQSVQHIKEFLICESTPDRRTEWF